MMDCVCRLRDMTQRKEPPPEKRQMTAAHQNLTNVESASPRASASWSAAVLCRFRVGQTAVSAGRTVRVLTSAATMLGCLLGLLLAPVPLGWAADSGSSVVVVYNKAMPESKEVAEHYAKLRQVPDSQVFGFELPATEPMSRSDYVNKLERPLLNELVSNQLFTLDKSTNSRKVVDARIRYVVLCYGVPTKILAEAELKEEGQDSIPLELRGNDASVDSELACLPISGSGFHLAGIFQNRFYAATNGSTMHPTNGILLVTRLDGPSAAIASALVDKAMEAETNGLWGRAYIDSRGITNGAFKIGDDWMRNAANVCRRTGFDTELDEQEKTFPASHPMSHIAIYAGWYDQSASGPFTQPKVEFMPGAFAYHLYSFNARILRTDKDYWTGALLAKGATVTFGSVEEPYLSGTIDVPVFCSALIYLGFSFGEAAYAAQNVLSWKTTSIGDPLYRPFGRPPQELHADLGKRKHKNLEWSHLRVVNLNLASGYERDEALQYLEELPLTKTSAVLTEKVGDIYWSKKKLSDALEFYERALKLGPSPQQKIRLTLNLAHRRTYFGDNQSAYKLYEQFVNEFPQYPDLLSIYKKLHALAQKLEKPADAERWKKEIERVSPPTPKTGTS
jgi:uncharacterized protein (TIGR03790 family)